MQTTRSKPCTVRKATRKELKALQDRISKRYPQGPWNGR